MAVIEYRNLYKTFDTPVLAGLSLTVHDGETLAIVGPSGTGKSVLLKTTIGLIAPDSGDVFIDGESVVHADRHAIQRIRRKAGYVFQNAALFDSMSVYENVLLGLPEGSLQELGEDEVLRRVRESLLQVNLDADRILNKLPADLSGGMRKRVGLARAIVGHPEIIFYDEPVTGLDPVNAAAVERLIQAVDEQLGATSILVTHDIEGALTVADRIGLLDSGRLRFLGTPQEFRDSDDALVRAFSDRQAAADEAARTEAQTGLSA